jgi:hypothetical protein
MKLRTLTWLFVLALASLGLDGSPRAMHNRYHCMCGDICTKAAPADRCQVKGCNGSHAQ